ncbi:GNAT family N-acetyltransferase [Salininema proteolyticum]|uniref:GNAT family N-acetyltransferase n=1 Tax=Salininema proteolyticum TaxID=1607685 RepID=A0ABV8U518_9ACTN
MSVIAVRRAAADDVGRVAELVRRLFREDSGVRDGTVDQSWPERFGRRWVRGLIGDDEAFLGVVEGPGGGASGYLAGEVGGPTSMRTVRVATLVSLYVDETLRRRGAARELVRVFGAWAEEKGADRIAVTAFASNEAALAFYRSEGFEPRETSMERPVG